MEYPSHTLGPRPDRVSLLNPRPVSDMSGFWLDCFSTTNKERVDFLDIKGENMNLVERSSDSTDDEILVTDERQPIFRFMDFPAEIRNHVYSLIFVCKDPVSPCKSRTQISDYVGILRTSRQVYSEAVQMLYGRNTFKTRERPIWTAEEFVNLLICQRRDGDLDLAQPSEVCLARHHLKKLYFPSQNMTIHLLRDLFSLLKYFPSLEQLRVVYVGSLRMKDRDVISACRELNKALPLKDFALCKRISYTAAETLSWMLDEQPPRNWSKLEIVDQDYEPNTWKNQDGVVHLADVVVVPP